MEKPRQQELPSEASALPIAPCFLSPPQIHFSSSISPVTGDDPSILLATRVAGRVKENQVRSCVRSLEPSALLCCAQS